MAITKRHINKILFTTLWCVLGIGMVTLLVAAISKKKTEKCKGFEIRISGVHDNYFIDKKDVIELLQKQQQYEVKGRALNSIDVAGMEQLLRKNKWIKNAELFFDNNNVLQVRVVEREPIVRIFTSTGSSFYIDSSLKRLPLSDKYSPRLPVFTSFPSDAIVLSKKDSGLLKQIRDVAQYISQDRFWMAQIEQTDINADREFEMVPKIGNQIIYFGDGNNYEQKFLNLLTFYKKVAPSIGWNTYAALNLKYSNQVVAVRRDAKEIRADSLRSIQIMKSIIATARKNTNDTTRVQLNQPEDDINIINTPHSAEDIPAEADDESPKALMEGHPDHLQAEAVINTESAKPIEIKQQSFKKPAPTPVRTLEKKNKKHENKNNQNNVPKAVMPAQNDR